MSHAKLHLIDGSGYIYRAFYAIRNLSTAAGEATNALHGFSQMLEKTLREERPTHMAIVFDSGKASFRNEIYSEYKAHRDAPPPELTEQVPKIHDLVQRFRIPTFVPVGFEADDVIATLTRIALEAGFDVRIISGDKDLMQLVSDRVSLWEPMRGKQYGPKEVEAYDKLLVPPVRVRDALALAGDSSDNIPGVRGIGPKKAAKLIQDFGDLEGVLTAAREGKVKGKMGQVLAESEDEARLSLKLVTLDEQVELPELQSMDDLKYLGPNKEAIKELYLKYEFRRTTPRLGDEHESSSSSVGPAEPDPAGIKLSHDRYHRIVDSESLQSLAQKLSEAPLTGVSVELSSHRLIDARVMGIAFCWGESEAAYVPIGHKLGPMEGADHQLSFSEVLAVLGPWFSSAKNRKSCGEAKLLSGYLMREGVTLRGVSFDPRVAAYLLHPDDPFNDLEAVSKRYLGHAAIARASLLTVAKKKRSFDRVPIDEAVPYMAERAEIAWRAQQILEPALDEAEVRDVLRDIELPLIPVLARIELNGLEVDLNKLQDLNVRFRDELEKLEATCFEAAGKEFNIGSPKQLRTILFDELGLKVTKTTKTGPSTDHAALEAIADDHPLPQAVIEHRTIQKLQNTYVEALPKMRVASSGRIHTQLNQTTAATGRLSSNEPNLQNIPIRTSLGRELRKAFVAQKGRVLISVDYSQIELRVLAHLSDDEVLVRAFEDRADVHARTASALFQIPPEEVSREQRTQAKAVNFGVLYGMGPVRLARELKIPRRTASQFVKDYFDRQPGVRKYIDDILEVARTEGAVRTLLGRRRRVTDINTENRAARSAAERVAINTPIQGTAADLMKMAMLRVDALLRDAYPDARLLLQVHDELLVEALADDAQEIATAVQDAMQRVYPLKVPLEASAHFGQNWDEAH